MTPGHRVRFTSFFCIALCMVAGVVISGCVGLLVRPYGYATEDGDVSSDRTWSVVMPATAPSISQGYSPAQGVQQEVQLDLDRNPVHEGIDIIAPVGTPVLAAAAGTVVRSFFDPLYGNQVEIDHGRDEKGRTMRTRYLHLQKKFVQKNDRVSRGAQIGTLGRSGALAAGIAHLHFEVLVVDVADGGSISLENPHIFWAGGPGAVTCFTPGDSWPRASFFITYPVLCKKEGTSR